MEKSLFDPTYSRRRKVVGVMGSSSAPHADLSATVGVIIANLGCHLLTGGGHGVMAAVSEAFSGVSGRAGLVIGVIRAGDEVRCGLREGKRSYVPRTPPNESVEIPIFTHLPTSGPDGKGPTSRNHINVLTSDVVVALPGGPGTLSEVELALEYEWPLILFVGSGTIGGRSSHDLARNASGSVVAADSSHALEEYLSLYRS